MFVFPGIKVCMFVVYPQVYCLMLCQAMALLVVYVLQFFNTMLLGSLYISFTIAATVVFIAQVCTYATKNANVMDIKSVN